MKNRNILPAKFVLSLAFSLLCAAASVSSNTLVTGNGNGPSIAENTDGSSILAYTRFDDSTGDFNVHVQRFNSDGSPRGAELKVNSLSAELVSDGAEPSIGLDSDGSGNFVVAWYQDDAGQNLVIARFYNSDGTAKGDPVDVSGVFSASSLPPIGVSMNTSGQSIISWRSDSTAESVTRFHAQRFEANGEPSGGQLELTSGSFAAFPRSTIISLPGIALNDSGAFVLIYAWNEIFAQISPSFQIIDTREIRVTRFAADNTLLGTDTLFHEQFSGGEDFSEFRFTSIDYANSGDYVGVWEREFSIEDPDPTVPVTTVYRIGMGTGNTSGINASAITVAADDTINFDPDVAIDSDGNIRVVWSGAENSEDPGIYVRDYSLSGSPSTEATLFARTPPSSLGSVSPTISSGSANSFSIAWERRDSLGGVGASGDIFLQPANPAPSSPIPVLKIEFSSSSEIRLSWNTEDGIEYDLLSATELADLSAIETITGTGSEASRSFQIEGPSRFWALRAK